MTNGYADWGSSKPSSTKKGKSGESSKSTVEKTPVYKDSAIHNGDRFSIGGGIDAAYNALGNLIDKGFDNTLGELIYNATGQTVDPRRWLTGENLGTALDIGSDILLPIIAPGVGSAIVAGKAAAQNMPTLVEAFQGVDQETGEELTDAQQWLKGASALGNVALMSMPLAGQLARTARLGKFGTAQAAKNGLFGDKTATRAVDKALSGEDDLAKKAAQEAREANKADFEAAQRAHQDATNAVTAAQEAERAAQEAYDNARASLNNIYTTKSGIPMIRKGAVIEPGGEPLARARRAKSGYVDELNEALKSADSELANAGQITTEKLAAAKAAKKTKNAADKELKKIAQAAEDEVRNYNNSFKQALEGVSGFTTAGREGGGLRQAWRDPDRSLLNQSMKSRKAALAEQGVTDDFDMANNIIGKLSGKVEGEITAEEANYIQAISKGAALKDPRAIEMLRRITKERKWVDPSNEEKLAEAKKAFEKTWEKVSKSAAEEFKGIGKSNKGFRPGQFAKDVAAYGTAGYANFLAENEGATPWDMIQADPAAFIGSVLGSALLRRANVGNKLPTLRGYNQRTPVTSAGNLGPSNAALRSIIAGQLGTNQQTQQLLEDENGDTYEGLRDVADEIVRGGRPLYRRGYLSENYG